MNVLSEERKTTIKTLLERGLSHREIARVTGTHRSAIKKVAEAKAKRTTPSTGSEGRESQNVPPPSTGSGSGEAQNHPPCRPALPSEPSCSAMSSLSPRCSIAFYTTAICLSSKASPGGSRRPLSAKSKPVLMPHEEPLTRYGAT